MKNQNKRIVIIGGGFGGLNCALQLRNTKFEITLIDRTNYHLFQPLLYQVASSALSPGDIATPIRAVLKKNSNIRTVLGQAISIDIKKKIVKLSDKTNVEYDYLVIATGSRHHYFGHEEWEKYAPGLKTIHDALSIREKILMSFEKAEVEYNSSVQMQYLTFVVVGGGPTGVELAGAIAEIATKTLAKNFRRIDSKKSRIILVEGSDRVLPTFTPRLSLRAKRSLERRGVEIRLNAMVGKIDATGVTIGKEKVVTSNIIWAAGNTTNPLVKDLQGEFDSIGRIKVEKNLSLRSNPEIFVIGDAAHCLHKSNPLPGIAPVALQQGRFVGKLLRGGDLKSKEFRYFDKGIMATIGKSYAVVKVGKLEISGLFAWLVWIFVHIAYLIGFRNRVIVLTEWFWNYITGQRGDRLIINMGKELPQPLKK